MNPLKKILDKLRNKVRSGLTRFREMGTYRAVFSGFGNDMYQSELVRACIRPLADQTAKANPVSNSDQLARLIRYRPNMYMTGRDFLYKVRTVYELKNTAFILIMRDDSGYPTGFYPIPYQSYEVFEDSSGRIYIRFQTSNGTYIFDWEDLVVLRKDYNASDIAGDDNYAILETLDLINTSNQSIENAVKSTANLRGILKTTKSMIDPADAKRMKDDFVADYLDPETGDGFAALDASMDFIQTNIQPTVTSWETMREFRENVFRYFGVNDAILMGTATPEQMQTFYELQIEPFLVALSREMTSKCFTDRQIAFGNYITFDSSTVQFMSMSDKLNLQAVVDRGAMSINEWREVLNLPPVEGGDTFVRRLDTAPVDEANTDDTAEDNDEQGNQ